MAESRNTQRPVSEDEDDLIDDGFREEDHTEVLDDNNEEEVVGEKKKGPGKDLDWEFFMEFDSLQKYNDSAIKKE